MTNDDPQDRKWNHLRIARERAAHEAAQRAAAADLYDDQEHKMSTTPTTNTDRAARLLLAISGRPGPVDQHPGLLPDHR